MIKTWIEQEYQDKYLIKGYINLWLFKVPIRYYKDK